MPFLRRRRSSTPDTEPEARVDSSAPARPEQDPGPSVGLPEADRALTVVLVSRSDRHALLPATLSALLRVFGADVDIRAVGYVADASPRGEQHADLPWVRPEPADGLGSALDVGTAAGVGRTVLVLDSTVTVPDDDLLALVAAGADGVVQARVRLAEGARRNGALLLRPGALPWSDDGTVDVPSGASPSDDVVFAADQPVIAMPRAALGAAPRLPDERMTLAAWSRAAADRIDGAVRLVGSATRSAEAGRTIDAATVDAFSAWRDRPADGDGDVVAGPPLPPWGARPVVPRARSTDRSALGWALKIAAPAGSDGDGWGDVHFAAELAAALGRFGQHVRIDRRDAHVRGDDADDDVTLVVRGLDRVPPNPATVNLLWVISHPDEVADTELRSFDAVFSAGPVWGAAAAERAGVPVRTLLQATDTAVFRPGAAATPDAGRVVFVGSTRGAVRPIVGEAVALGADLVVHGPGWSEAVPASMLGAASLARHEVAAAYASARVVLNDHWPDMAAGGFVSNRVFDVLAAGGVVVTDPVAGLASVLDVPTLAVAPDRAALADLLDPLHAWPTADERAAVAARIAAEHSFDARAAVLLETARTERARLRR